MEEWQQLLQSVFFGLIFSYLLAKLISVVTSFKNENLTVTRNPTATTTTTTTTTASKRNLQIPVPNDARLEADTEAKKSPIHSGPVSPTQHETDSVSAEQGSMRYDSSAGGTDGDYDDDDDDDDDWEGVESTELDEAFSAATAFIAAAASDRLSQKIANDMQLQLYGLYKIATEGPCNAPQPSALKMTARAKWQAWQKLGAMPPEDAMQKYIDIVTELYPSWLAGSSLSKARDPTGRGTDVKDPVGPVFSTFIYEEQSGNESKMDAIHAFAREGDAANLLKSIESDVSVNIRDSEGRTPLHWAVDRGQLDVVELLVSKDADLNLKDNDGQTPLHYAVVCEREAIAQYLVKHNANADLKDNDGNSPCDLCDSNWSWMQHTKKQVG